MALKAVLTKADFDALPEILQEHYAAGADGESYVLDADVDAHPKLAGLKSALEKERTAAKTKTAAEKQYAELLSKIGDMDIDKAREAMATVRTMSDQKLLDAGKVDELIRSRTEAMEKSHQEQAKAYQAKIDELTKSYGALDGEFTTMVLDGSIRDEAMRAGAKPEHLEDIVYRLKDRGLDGVKWKLGDGRKVVAMHGDEIKYGKDPSAPMTIGEGLETLRKGVPGFFLESKGGGAQNAGRSVGGRFVISEADARDRSKYLAAESAATKAGQVLEIAQ